MWVYLFATKYKAFNGDDHAQYGFEQYRGISYVPISSDTNLIASAARGAVRNVLRQPSKVLDNAHRTHHRIRRWTIGEHAYRP